MVKKISILGSTGSIGTSTLKVVSRHPEQFAVEGLAAYSNVNKMIQQVQDFHPKVVAMYDPDAALQLQKHFPKLEVLAGDQGIEAIATLNEVSFVMSAIVGAAGIGPTLAAIEAGKDIGLANKEVLVAAGDIVMKRVAEKSVALLPVDSEHSALFQCLHGQDKTSLSRLILTASGGPFWKYSKDQLQNVSLEQALKHPNWSMGKKVTIDSSTLMNKGLEFIEAYHLFQVPLDKIEVVVHPQSLIHSMVEFQDGALLAQISEPCMTQPIQYAMTYPHRLEATSLKPFNFSQGFNMEFYPPDQERFPCLSLAKNAIAAGGSYPCYLNAANEILVERFVEKKIAWQDIAFKLTQLLDRHERIPMETLNQVWEVNNQAREEAKTI